MWRREDGSIVTLELLPDAGTHAPTVFYDETGREQLSVPDEPADLSSPQTLETQRRRDMVTEDASKAEMILCHAR